MNQNNATPIEQVVLEFMQRLTPQVISLVYTGNSQILDKAVTTARNVEGG